MSQKLLYRTACFLFGFGIGVIYFASPSSNTQRVHADTPKQIEQPDDRQEARTPTVSPDQIDALEKEAAQLAALEAQIERELGGSQPATKTVAASSAIESVVESEAQPDEAPVVGPVVHVSAEQETTVEPVVEDAIEKSEVTEELEEYRSNVPTPAALTQTNSHDTVRAMPRTDSHIRAQMKRHSGLNPARVVRKVIFFQTDGASANEKYLEIDVENGIPGEELVPIDFEKDEKYSRIIVQPEVPQRIERKEQSPSVSQASIVPVVNRRDSLPGNGLKKQVTDLKQQNLDLREQVLSLRVMMEAIEDDTSASQVNSVANEREGDRAVDSPKVLSVTKQNSNFWQSQEQQGSVSRARVVAQGPTRQASGSFESQPGDPVLVRYDRTPLRLGPGTHYSRVAVLREGTVLRVDYHRDGWFRVFTQDGVRAWIAKDAIRWF